MKLSEEIKHCLDNNGCDKCGYGEPETKLTCRGLLQAAYEEIKKNEKRGGRGMNRLTRKDGKETYCSSNKICSCEHAENVFKKLAEYEDLEEQGKLLKLPCKVGDTVYAIHWRKWCKDENDYIGGNVICMNCNTECKSRMEYFIEEIPATLACIANIVWHKEHQSDNFLVFLTKPEAEEALKKMNEKEGENE